MKRLGQRLALGLLVAVILVSAATGITGPGRAAVKALLFIPEILPNAPVRPQRWLVAEPTRQTVRFPVDGGQGVGDLYIPAGGGKLPAIVLFFGVIPAGPDDPRITNLAQGLARSKMVVLIPWSDVMTTSYRLDPKAVDLLVGAYQYLERHPAVNTARIGLGGFCVGASFAALAAEDDHIRDRVAYVNSFGGYYDARDLLVAIASQTRFYDTVTEPWEPRDDSRTVFAAHLLEGLPDAQEGEMLARELGFLKDPPAATYDPVSISEEARAIRSLLSGVTREEAQSLLGSLPSTFLEDLALISPSTRIGDLKAPVLIMHDREDTAVPSEESRRLAEALKDRGQVYYTEFSLFQHVDPTRSLPPSTMARELWKLVLHMYNIMRLGT